MLQVMPVPITARSPFMLLLMPEASMAVASHGQAFKRQEGGCAQILNQGFLRPLLPVEQRQESLHKVLP